MKNTILNELIFAFFIFNISLKKYKQYRLYLAISVLMLHAYMYTLISQSLIIKRIIGIPDLLHRIINKIRKI